MLQVNKIPQEAALISSMEAATGPEARSYMVERPGWGLEKVSLQRAPEQASFCSGHGSELSAFKQQWCQTWGLNFGWSSVETGIGRNGSHGSLPTQCIL